jgi:hypothetical protein
MNTFNTREDWLTQGVNEIRPFFEVAGHTLPDAIRVACGFPYARSPLPGHWSVLEHQRIGRWDK